MAVSTFPDFDFTGDGESSGRYVLQVNRYRGTVLAAGDDTSTPLNLGFNFRYQGTNYNSVFVNSNGNLTFGVGDTDFSESVAEFLAGPPRIAPRWDDLDAGDGVIVVSTDEDDDFDGHHDDAIVKNGGGHDDDDSVTIHFVSVPEFFTTSPNYFSIKLEEDDDEIEFDYGATARTDGLTGITQGGGAADPGEKDLSRDDDHPNTGTTYEFFTPADVFSFDLFFYSLEFEDD